ncbi:acyl-CoA reductase [Flavobacteriaceae bacterium F08102]|nr:acyl-CoA reductase [Flavobacteriaceae bacterium F08102]
MLLESRINAFAELGLFLSQFSRDKRVKKTSVMHNDPFFEAVDLQIKRAHEFNGWFTEDHVLYCFENWANQLTKGHLENWTSGYFLETKNPKKVAIIMAGNIPLVGFHDFISVLMAGHHALVKLSSNDKHLLPLLAKYLGYVEPSLRDKITFVEGQLPDFDAAIATGSNNTARYFDYYFKKYPHIIRKNRNSVAVLTGQETHEELTALGEDIFRYFGLGCRSVSKIFVPRNYDFDLLFKAVYAYKDVLNYKKYEHNYDYNKAVYLMSNFKLLENGFLMLKEDESYSSPISSLFYEYYDDLDQLTKKLAIDAEKIQCVVSNVLDEAVPFGQTQVPSLNDYADGVDTLAFLSSLN